MEILKNKKLTEYTTYKIGGPADFFVDAKTEDEIIKWWDREDHDKFDFCSDDHCQRYQGITKVITEYSFNAVEETRGIVLTEGNEICDTRFSKC